MNKKCSICQKKPVNRQYCEIHYSAYKNLKETYKIWLRAYDRKIDFQDYLDIIFKLKETGQAVKEIIPLISSKGDND